MQPPKLRPVRTTDRQRMLEICTGMEDGHDHLPRVFDSWLRDPGSTFQAAELDGVVIGFQRLRPLSRRLAWYEGLRVAAGHRRRGLARLMLRSALNEARRLGFAEVRLISVNPAALRLFAQEGFEVLIQGRFWEASRMEGGEIARIPGPAEVPGIHRLAQAQPAFTASAGIISDWNGAHDLDQAQLERLAAAGRLRITAGGRALAVVGSTIGTRLIVAFASGSGASLKDLLLMLRYEADTDDLEGVTLALPEGFPGQQDLGTIGYRVRRASPGYQICGVQLTE